MSHSFRARTLVLGAAILLTLAGTGCNEIPEADPSADPATTVTTEAATETADTPDATSGTTQAPGTALSPNAPLPSSSDSSTASGPLADVQAYTQPGGDVVFRTADNNMLCTIGTQEVSQPTQAGRDAAGQTDVDGPQGVTDKYFTTQTVPAVSCQVGTRLDVHQEDRHYCYGIAHIGTAFALWSGGYSVGECRGDVSLGMLCTSAEPGSQYCEDNWYAFKELPEGQSLSAHGFTCTAGNSTLTCTAPDGRQMTLDSSDYTFR